MTTTEIDTESPYQRLQASRGQAYIDRAHLRTFSLNILQMNGLEFLETVRRLSDPRDGISLLSQDNREAGAQAHRELSRHFHNFLASAKTLVDHTRVLMREHYSDTPLLSAFEQKAGHEVGATPVVKFVHDLRNYMLHRGLPNTERFANWERDPEHPERGLMAKVGVRLRTNTLLAWSGWVAPARSYLQAAGEALDIQEFVEHYLTEVAGLHAWLDAELAQHHLADLEETRRLEAEFLGQGPAGGAEATQQAPAQPEPEPFTFTAEQRDTLDQSATDLLGKIRLLAFQQRSSSFPSLRPRAAEITDKDILDTPVFRGPDAEGSPVVAFIERGADTYGLDADVFAEISELARLAQQAPWAREGLGRQFVEDCFIAWARKRSGTEESLPFSRLFSDAAREAVVSREVWAPVAHLEVQAAFGFGPVTIAPITPEVLAGFRRHAEPQPEQAQAVDAYFEKLRLSTQGLAAVVLRLDAEPRHAEEKALLVAQDAVTLLRFFSPGAPLVDLLCPTELLGAERVPTSTLLVDFEGGFSSSSRILTEDVSFWQMPAAQLPDLREAGLEAVGRLVSALGLSPFEADVRSSLMIYSRSLTVPDARHRLSQALAALEGLLLRHQMEPRAAATADRAGLIIGEGETGRREMADLFRRGYRFLETQSARPLWPDEIQLARTVVFSAYGVLQTAIGNLDRFPTRAAFLDAVEHRRNAPG